MPAPSPSRVGLPGHRRKHRDGHGSRRGRAARAAHRPRPADRIAGLAVAGQRAGQQRIDAWAGPWLLDERWWAADRRPTGARVQLVTESGVALLVRLTTADRRVGRSRGCTTDGLEQPQRSVERTGTRPLRSAAAAGPWATSSDSAPGIPQLAAAGTAPDRASGQQTPRRPGCPTPNCTATPRSASSTAHPPRNIWWRRRSGSGWTRWPSPITTVSTASSGSPRRPQDTGLRTLYGAELSLGLPEPQMGIADPVGDHLLVLARGQEGYNRLSVQISRAQLDGGEKGRPSLRPGRAGRRQRRTSG